MRLVRRGRPRKFGRPARPITVTLPDDVIDRLTRVDADLGRAIVRVADAVTSGRVAALPPAVVAKFGRGAVILVTPSKHLRGLSGVDLVPLFDGRALIALSEGLSVAELELKVRDALEDPATTESERHVLTALAAILGQARRSQRLEVSTRRIIMLRSKRTARA